MGISKIGPNLFFIKVRVKPDGPGRRRQEQFQGTKAQAEQRYLELKAEIRGASRLQVSARTFGNLLQRYEMSRGGIPRSQRSIFEALQRDLGAVELSRLQDALEQYVGILRRMPSKATGKPLSIASLNRYRAMVAATLNLAVELKAIEKTPLTASVWPKGKERPRDRFLQPHEVDRLLQTIAREAPHLLPLTRFALQVPCRKSELVGMTRADLDLINGAIRVKNGTTKNDEGTWKPIPPDMVTYFRTLPAETTFLFFRRVGGKYLPLGDFKKAWRTCLQLAGVADFRFHDTRHISATNLVDNGTPERAVMDIAGWKTNMLSTYYKSSSRKALALVRFAPGRGNQGATSPESAGKAGDFGTERAVS